MARRAVRLIDLPQVGHRQGIITVIAVKLRTISFACDCGTVFDVAASSMTKRYSCGCSTGAWQAEANRTHGFAGGSRTRRRSEYVVWSSMITRCSSPGHRHWHRYGGRGIVVCERWKKFENFIADMGERPSRKHSIDRIDNDGNYEPGNCRWATSQEQHNNKHGLHKVRVGDTERTIAEWARRAGLHSSTLLYRLSHGWPPEVACTQGPTRTEPRLFLTYLGETRSIKEWAGRIGVPARLIRGRIYNGWPAERALSAPVRQTSRATEDRAMTGEV